MKVKIISETFIGRIARFGRYYGWTELLRRIVLSSTGWLIENRNVVIMMLMPQDITCPDSTFEFKEITRSDIDEIFKVMYFSREHVMNRFERGERCFAILNKGNIVTYLWATFTKRSMKELYMNIQLRPNQSWFYNALTVKDARGKGHYPNIIRHMAKTLQNEGVSEIFIDVEGKNTASIRGIEKTGFKKVICVKMKKIFPCIKYRVKVFDYLTWTRLSEEIEYPQERASVHWVITHGG